MYNDFIVYPVLLYLYDMHKVEDLKKIFRGFNKEFQEIFEELTTYSKGNELLEEEDIYFQAYEKLKDCNKNGNYIFKDNFLDYKNINTEIFSKKVKVIFKTYPELKNKTNNNLLKFLQNNLKKFIEDYKFFIMSFSEKKALSSKEYHILTPIKDIKDLVESIKKGDNYKDQLNLICQFSFFISFNKVEFNKIGIKTIENINNFKTKFIGNITKDYQEKPKMNEPSISQLIIPNLKNESNLDNMISFIIYQKTIYCIDDKKNIFKIEGNPFGIFKSNFFLKDKKFIISKDMLIAYNYNFTFLFADIVSKYSKNPQQLVDFLKSNNDNYKNIDECELETKSLKDELEDEIEEAYNEFLDKFYKIDITDNNKIIEVLDKIHKKLEDINLKINTDSKFQTYKNLYISKKYSKINDICNLKENLVEYVRYFCDVTRANLKLKQSLETPKDVKYQREIINIIKKFIS